MENKITDDDIKKAIIQAEANMGLEEVSVNEIVKKPNKVFRKEYKNVNNKLR